MWSWYKETGDWQKLYITLLKEKNSRARYLGTALIIPCSLLPSFPSCRQWRPRRERTHSSTCCCSSWAWCSVVGSCSWSPSLRPISKRCWNDSIDPWKQMLALWLYLVLHFICCRLTWARRAHGELLWSPYVQCHLMSTWSLLWHQRIIWVMCCHYVGPQVIS